MSEGVIKFGIERWDNTPPLAQEIYQDLEKYRNKLHNLKLIGVDLATHLGYGNISTLIGEERFLITSTQTGHLKNLNGKHYSIVDSVNFDTNSITCSGYSKPSSEAISHGAFYRSNSNLRCVIHIHNEQIWNKLISQNGLQTGYDVEYGSIELYKSIIDLLSCQEYKKPFVVVIKGHQDGVFIAGDNIASTYEEVINLIGA